MSLQFAVVHEAPADFQTATELADRVLVESIDWMEEDLIEHHRTWIREASGVPLTWKRIKQSRSREWTVRILQGDQGVTRASDHRS